MGTSLSVVVAGEMDGIQRGRGLDHNKQQPTANISVPYHKLHLKRTMDKSTEFGFVR